MARAGKQRTRPSALLFLLCLALGAAVYQELGSGAWSRLPKIAAPRTTPEITLPAPLPDFQMAPLADFTATLDRPLFLPERRPPEIDEQAKQEAKAALTPLKVVVSGVIMSDAGTFALVQREGATEILRLAVRDTIDGWSVTDILPDRVVFRRGAERQEVELKDLAPQHRPSVRPPGRDRRRQRAVPQNPPSRSRAAPGSAGAQDKPATSNSVRSK